MDVILIFMLAVIFFGAGYVTYQDVHKCPETKYQIKFFKINHDGSRGDLQRIIMINGEVITKTIDDEYVVQKMDE